MIKKVYYRDPHTPYIGVHNGLVLKNRHVLIFTEEGLEIRKLRKYCDDIDTEARLAFYAHLHLIGDPYETVDVKKIEKMSVVEFFEYLMELRNTQAIRLNLRGKLWRE